METQSTTTTTTTPRGLQLDPDLNKSLIVHSNTIILAPAMVIYKFWRDLKNLPRFTEQLESIEVLSETKSHWTWKALRGRKQLDWTSEIVEDQPGKLISWQSVEPAEVKHMGVISFQELPKGRGTLVDVKFIYDPPGGKITDALEKFLKESPLQNLNSDLYKLRQLMEVGVIPTIEGQPRGGLH